MISWRCWFRIRTDIWNSDHKSHFWANLHWKIKAVRFGWKLAHLITRECWFSFRHYFSEFPTIIPFLGKFRLKRLKLPVLPGNWHSEYLENADSYSNVTFLNFQLSCHFWANLRSKSQNCLFSVLDHNNSYSDNSFLQIQT